MAQEESLGCAGPRIEIDLWYYMYMFRNRKTVQKVFGVVAVIMVITMIALAMGPSVFQ